MPCTRVAVLAAALAGVAGTAIAGIDSKEVGGVLIYPTYQAYDGGGNNIDTYLSVTNDKAHAIKARFEVIGDVVCDDCSFDVLLAPYQTRRLLLDRETVGQTQATIVYDASLHSGTGDVPILAACSEPEGFVVVTIEDPDQVDARTLGENLLHGDLVIVDLSDGTSSRMSAIAVRAVGPNDGDQWIEFDGVEYAKLPGLVSGPLGSPSTAVEPKLVLFNVDFTTGDSPVEINECTINYMNAGEDRFAAEFRFDCYTRITLRDLAHGLVEDIPGTDNGFLWAACDQGTNGSLIADREDAGSNDAFPFDFRHSDTLFAGTTVTRDNAKLKLTRFPHNDPGATREK